MKSVLFSTVLVCSFLLALPAMAYTPILHSGLQAVYEDGTTTWPASGSPYSIQLLGVVINNPEDMLDYTTYSVGEDCVEWQTYIQALPVGTYGNETTGYYTVTSSDYGGTAMYMRATQPWGSYDVLYTELEWPTELKNLTTNADTLQYGDIVVVQANAPGKFYNGKYNINELNSNDPANNFSITVLGAATPAAPTITLAALKYTTDDSFDEFIFDASRATGCEHYQASLVHLEGLQLVSGTWAKDETVTVRQTVEENSEWHTLTFDLKLGLDDDLFTSAIVDAVTNNPFDVTAILDQEDDSMLYTGDYRLWLTSASNLNVVPEPGSLMLLVAGGLAALLLWRRSGRTTA